MVVSPAHNHNHLDWSTVGRPPGRINLDPGWTVATARPHKGRELGAVPLALQLTRAPGRRKAAGVSRSQPLNARVQPRGQPVQIHTDEDLTSHITAQTRLGIALFPIEAPDKSSSRLLGRKDLGRPPEPDAFFVGKKASAVQALHQQPPEEQFLTFVRNELGARITAWSPSRNQGASRGYCCDQLGPSCAWRPSP